MRGTWPLFVALSATRCAGLARSLLRRGTVLVVCAVGASTGLLFGCTNAGPAPRLFGVKPGAGYSDLPLALRLEGEGFRPSVSVSATAGAVDDPGQEVEIALLPADGGPPIKLTGAHVESPSFVEAMVPAKLPAGTYDLTFSDNRGHHLSLPAAFTSLGPDLVPPVVELREPLGPALFANQKVDFKFETEDASPPVMVNFTDDRSAALILTSCPCTYSRTTPSLADDEVSTDYAITARALDLVGNRTNKRFVFRIIPRPRIEDFGPRVGPEAGGTSVALTGAQIPEDGRIFVDDVPLVPNGGERAADGSSIRGWMPPHPPGVAEVVLRSAAGEIPLAPFTYNKQPKLTVAQPPSLPTNDGCHIVQLVADDPPSDGKWFLGHDGTDRVPLPEASVDASEGVIRLCVPPAFGVGPVSFFLESASAGPARLDGGFSFDDSSIESTTAAVSCDCPP